MTDEDRPEVRFTLTDEQRLLRDTVRGMLTDRAPSKRVREVMMEDGTDLATYEELAGLGLTGLAVPEELGGAGSTFVEVGIVMEELGRRLAPVPYLSSVVLGLTAVLEAGDESQLAAIVPPVIAGAQRLALAHLDADGRDRTGVPVTARREGEAWVLDGVSGFVVDGATATTLLVAADTGQGTALFVVPADGTGLVIKPIDVLDLTRPMATVRLDSVRLDGDARLAGDGAAAIDAAVTAGAVALASEQLGGAQHVLELTTGYARSRVQFGRAIGSFQAVKHRLAEMLVKVESARSTAEYATRVLAAGDTEELAIAAPVAKAYVSQVYEEATSDALQLHGGIGFTWEHDVHLYFKRAKSTKLLLGSPAAFRARLGDAIGV